MLRGCATPANGCAMSRTPASEAARRRTFAIISHPDAGKTTLTEHLLLLGGAIHAAGRVKARGEARRAKSDWMKIEQERGISVTSAVMTFEYKDAVFNLARAAMLAMALRDGDWDKLDSATQDRIHQPYRAHLIQGLDEMFQAARHAGAYCAFLGGAGPSVVALGPPGSKAGEVMRKVFQAHGAEARVLELQPSPYGAYAEITAL